MVLDNASRHHRRQGDWPQNMPPLPLPPDSPELNPAEQSFRHLRQKLSHRLFTTFDELQDALLDECQPLWEQPTARLHLTGYPCWLQALPSNLSSSS